MNDNKGDRPEPAARFVHTPEGHFILEINAEWIRLLDEDELPEDGDPLFTGEQVEQEKQKVRDEVRDLLDGHGHGELPEKYERNPDECVDCLADELREQIGEVDGH